MVFLISIATDLPSGSCSSITLSNEVDVPVVSREFRTAIVLSLPFRFPFRRGLKFGKDYKFAIEFLFVHLIHTLCLNHCKILGPDPGTCGIKDIFISDLRQSRIGL